VKFVAAQLNNIECVAQLKDAFTHQLLQVGLPGLRY
jgi:hypothetical protein